MPVLLSEFASCSEVASISVGYRRSGEYRPIVFLQVTRRIKGQVQPGLMVTNAIPMVELARLEETCMVSIDA